MNIINSIDPSGTMSHMWNDYGTGGKVVSVIFYGLIILTIALVLYLVISSIREVICSK